MKGVFAPATPKQAPLNRNQRRQNKHKLAKANAGPSPQDIAQLTHLLQGEMFDACIKRARQMTTRWPAHPLAWVVLGICQNATRDYSSAEQTLQKALLLVPENPDANNSLGQALQAQGKLHAAEQSYSKALSLKPDHIEARCNLAQTFWDNDQLLNAKAQFEKVLAQNPDLAQPHLAQPRIDMARLALAHVHKELGDFKTAQEHYRALLASPDCWSAARFQLTSLKKFQPGDQDLPPVLEALERDDITDTDRIHLSFAAGKAFNDIGTDPDATFAHYRTGNQLKRAQIKFRIEQEEKNLATIARHFNTGEQLTEPANETQTPTPVFIIGMPRSGTTLVEQILASHKAVIAGGERKDLERAAKAFDATQSQIFPDWASQLDAKQVKFIADEYWQSHFAADAPAKCFTDKMPSNFKFLGLINTVLPQAKIIHLQRNPVDTCLSCYFQLFAEGSLFSYDLSDLGRYYQAYQKLMSFWQQALPAGTILNVVYEDIIRDPKANIRQMLSYLDLDWDENCLNFHQTKRPVRTASSAQVRQPLYASSVNRWKPFEPHLRPLLDALGSD